MHSNDISIDDISIMKEREWEVRHGGGCLDRKGEEFMKDYLHLPQSFTRSPPQLRERAPPHNPPIYRNPSSSQRIRKSLEISEGASRANGVTMI